MQERGSGNKVFVIGLSKTGTTSLGQCLAKLGCHHLPFNRDTANAFLRRDWEYLDQQAAVFDSVDDWPWPALFKRLDRLYPDAKFILTFRKDPQRWLKSYQNHCLTHWPRLREVPLYNRAFFGFGFPHGNESRHLDLYHAHFEVVRAHFAGRPEKLLQFCIDDSPTWEPICQFLDLPIPTLPFPHSNVADHVSAGSG